MDDVRFADGFDIPDRLAFGLAASQLAVVAGGGLLAYLLVRSPLPAPLAWPLGVAVAGVAAGLGWLRLAGRPLLDWAGFAARHLAAPRRQQVRFEITAATPPASPTPRPAAMPMRPFVVRDAVEVAVAPPPPPARVDPPQRRQGGEATHRGRDRRGAHRLTFFSLKGGTGRTMLATELAAALAGQLGPGSRRLRVALLDLDLRSAAVGARLGLSGSTVHDYALAPPDSRRVADHLCVHAGTLRVLLGPTRPQLGEWPVTGALVREVLRELDMEGFDVVVIDVAAEPAPAASAVLAAADDVFVVVTPTVSGVHDAYRSTEALRRQGLRHQLRYVVNRARGDLALDDVMHDLGGTVVAEIPDDPAVTDAENAHRVATGGTGPAAHALQRFARRVAREITWSCAD